MSERNAFGPSLKAERDRRGITLQAIADSTKISISLLAALERNDMSRWPNGIFRRAFVREYVAALGLPPEPLVAEFVRLFPESPCSGGPENPCPGAPEVAELRLTLEAEPSTTWKMLRIPCVRGVPRGLRCHGHGFDDGLGTRGRSLESHRHASAGLLPARERLPGTGTEASTALPAGRTDSLVAQHLEIPQRRVAQAGGPTRLRVKSWTARRPQPPSGTQPQIQPQTERLLRRSRLTATAIALQGQTAPTR